MKKDFTNNIDRTTTNSNTGVFDSPAASAPFEDMFSDDFNLEKFLNNKDFLEGFDFGFDVGFSEGKLEGLKEYTAEEYDNNLQKEYAENHTKNCNVAFAEEYKNGYKAAITLCINILVDKFLSA